MSVRLEGLMGVAAEAKVAIVVPDKPAAEANRGVSSLPKPSGPSALSLVAKAAKSASAAVLALPPPAPVASEPAHPFPAKQAPSAPLEMVVSEAWDKVEFRPIKPSSVSSAEVSALATPDPDPASTDDPQIGPSQVWTEGLGGISLADLEDFIPKR